MTASPDGQVSVERRTLWIVLLLNVVIAAGFFVTGLIGDSSALIANGVDNLSDTAVYALSLIALSHGPTWKTRAATVSGVMLLISGETPSEHDRVVWLLQHFPAEVLNLSHFLSSLLGLVLVLLAWGLRERLDAAWIGSTIVSIAAAGLALFKGVNWEETAILAALAALLVSSRRAFPRHARLSRMEVSPGWMLSAFAMGYLDKLTKEKV